MKKNSKEPRMALVKFGKGEVPRLVKIGSGPFRTDLKIVRDVVEKLTLIALATPEVFNGNE